MPRYTDEELLENLKLIANDLGHSPLHREYNMHSLRIASSNTIAKRFGGWINAWEKAGLSSSIYQITHIRKKITIEQKNHICCRLISDLYENILRHPGISLTEIINKYCKNCDTTYSRYLGSASQIAKILKTKYDINLNIGNKYTIIWTKPLLKQEFKRIKILLNKNPSSTDFRKNTIYANVMNGIREIYGSYDNFMVEMECKPTTRKTSKDIIKTKQKYYLFVLKKIIQEQNTEDWHLYDFLKACHANRKTIEKNFNEVKNWFKMAHVKVPKFVGHSKNVNHISDEKIIKDIKKMTRTLKRVPGSREYQNNPNKIVSMQIIRKRFGSWNAALKAAGLTPQRRRKDDLIKQKIIDSIKNIADSTNKIPTAKAYSEHPLHVCSKPTVRKYFGSWNNALKAAGLK